MFDSTTQHTGPFANKADRPKTTQSPPCRWTVQLLVLLAVLCSASGLQAQVFEPPQSWLNGWVIIQNVMHNHQLLHAGDNGNGQLYAEWEVEEDHGEVNDYAVRWRIETSTTTGYYSFRNLMHPEQRLAVEDNSLRPIAGTGDDDSYLWQIETSGGFFALKNKLHDQRHLHVGHNGNGVLYAGDNPNPANDDAYRWQVHVLAWEGDRADLTYRPSSFYMASDILLENRRYEDRRIGVGYVLNNQPHAAVGDSDDLAYRWQLEESGQQGFYYLRNRLHPSQRLHAGHNGNGQLYLGCSSDDAFRWRLEPTAKQAFFLRNKLHSTQRVRLNGSDQLSAEWGTDQELQWLLIVKPAVSEDVCQ